MVLLDPAEPELELETEPEPKDSDKKHVRKEPHTVRQTVSQSAGQVERQAGTCLSQKVSAV